MFSRHFVLFVTTFTIFSCELWILFLVGKAPSPENESIVDLSINYSYIKKIGEKPKITKYEIFVEPDLENDLFHGTVKILFNSTLNEKLNFELDAAKSLNFDQSENNNIEFEHDKEREKLKITTLAQTKSILLRYEGKIYDDFYGLYKTYDITTKTKGVATQFEPHYARRVFPCYDEPSSRAVYQISIYAPNDLMALCNTEVLTTEKYKDGFIYHFKETPCMPSYLVCFCIGIWDQISAKTNRGVNVIVYTYKGRQQRGEFTLNIAKQSIDFLENYTGVNYVMDAIQYVPIPDFAAGAMENYGLVTCRDFYVDSDNQTSITSLSRIAEVIVHENAHMWFGNLVSPKSWDHTWLNEGFATIIPHFVLENTEYFPWSSFYKNVQQSAIDFDLSSYTHPIMVQNVTDPESMFDDITYNKGAAVLNMLRLYLSDSVFQDCLKAYLQKFQFQSTTTDDLIDVFHEVSQKNVAKFFQTWTTQKGFPTLVASIKNKRLLQIKQTRMTLSGIKKHSPTIWPFTLFFSDNIGIEFDSNGVEIQGWDLNPGRKAMVIIKYSPGLLDRLREEWKVRTPNDIKWVFLSDLERLILCNAEQISTAIDFIKLCDDENDPFVLSSLTSLSLFILQSIGSDTNESKLIIDLMSKYLEKLNSKSEYSLIEKETKKQLVLMLHHIGGLPYQQKKAEIEEDKDEFEDLFYRSWTKDGFNELIQRSNVSNNTRFIQQAQMALGSTRSGSEVQNIISMFGKDIKWQNAIAVMSVMSSNPNTRKELLHYMQENINNLYDTFGNGFQMERVIEILYKCIETNDELEKVNETVESSNFISTLKNVVLRNTELTKAKLKVKESYNI